MTKVVAHRGLHREVRENTVAAFAAAVAGGVDGVELDVRACADGLLVVHHDPDCEGVAIADRRATALPGYVASLADALRACDGVEVNVEIKMDAYDEHDPRRATFLERVVAEVDAFARGQRIIFSSFDEGACRYLRDIAPATPIGLLLDWGVEPLGALEGALEAGYAALHPYYRAVTPEVVATVQAAGLALNVWTPNERDDLVRLLDWGVDALITDDPELAVALRDRRT